MESVTPGLPLAMGSTAGLVVAAISMLAQAPPQTCVMRAVLAFLVFMAFGMVLRYILTAEAPASRESQDDGSINTAVSSNADHDVEHERAA